MTEYTRNFSFLKYVREDKQEHIWVMNVIEDYPWIKRFTGNRRDTIQLPAGSLMQHCAVRLSDDLDEGVYRFYDDNEDDRMLKEILLKSIPSEEFFAVETKAGGYELMREHTDVHKLNNLKKQDNKIK